MVVRAWLNPFAGGADSLSKSHRFSTARVTPWSPHVGTVTLGLIRHWTDSLALG